jgi:hypothetical protein
MRMADFATDVNLAHRRVASTPDPFSTYDLL